MVKKMKKKIKNKRFIKCFLISILLFLSTITVAMCILISRINYQMPEILNVELYDDNEVKYLSYSNGKKQSYVNLDKISNNLVNAFIAIEDKRFYNHHGVDTIRIGGALLKNFKSKKL